MRSWPAITILLAALATAATTAALARAARPRPMPDNPLDALIDAQQFDLLSLEFADNNDFHRDFHIIGQTRITDMGVRKRLIDALLQGIREKNGSYKCFDPRHGIRITRFGHVAEYIICFQCAKAEIFVDGQQVQGFGTSESPKPVFNEILKNAGIPLAYDPDSATKPPQPPATPKIPGAQNARRDF